MSEQDKPFEQMAETEVLVEVVVSGLFQLAQRADQLTPQQRAVILAAIATYNDGFQSLVAAMRESAHASFQ